MPTRRLIARSLLLFGLYQLVVSQAIALEPVWTIALAGGSAGSNTTFDSLQGGALGPDGKVVFKAFLTGGTITTENDYAVFVGSGGAAPVIFVQEGDPAPGLSGLSISGILTVVPGQQITYQGFIDGPDVTIYNNIANWQQSTLLARFEDPAPGLPEGVTWDSGSPSANRNGQVIVTGVLRGDGITSSDDDTIWVWSGGSWQLVAREGSDAPGGGTFVGFHPMYFADLGINARGSISFGGAIDDGTGTILRGAWVGAPSSLQRLVIEGDMLPVESSTAELALLQAAPVLDEWSERVALYGEIAGSQRVIWSGGRGQLQFVVKEDQWIDGEQIQSFGMPVIAGGTTAVRASVWTSAGEGILLHDNGGTRWLVRGGDTAPGAETGAVFASFGDPAINRHGQIAFDATLSGPTIDGTNDEGLWLLTTDGALQPLAIAGQDLDISPSDTRTVASVGVAGGALSSPGMGNGAALNDRGELFFYGSFTDGTSQAYLLSTTENFVIYDDGFESGGFGSWSVVSP